MRKTEFEQWSKNDLLTRPKNSYDESALNARSDFERGQLKLEYARAEYYGAIYKKQYRIAYMYLLSSIREKISLAEFQKYWEGFVALEVYPFSLTRSYGSIRSFRLVKSLPFRLDEYSGQLFVVLMKFDGSFDGKTVILEKNCLDAWFYIDGRAEIIPEPFIALQGKISVSL